MAQKYRSMIAALEIVKRATNEILDHLGRDPFLHSASPSDLPIGDSSLTFDDICNQSSLLCDDGIDTKSLAANGTFSHSTTTFPSSLHFNVQSMSDLDHFPISNVAWNTENDYSLSTSCWRSTDESMAEGNSSVSLFADIDGTNQFDPSNWRMDVEGGLEAIDSFNPLSVPVFDSSASVSSYANSFQEAPLHSDNDTRNPPQPTSFHSHSLTPLHPLTSTYSSSSYIPLPGPFIVHARDSPSQSSKEAHKSTQSQSSYSPPTRIHCTTTSRFRSSRFN